MNKYLMAGMGGAVAGALLIGQFAGPIFAQDDESAQTVYEQLDLFGDVFERIRSAYVEEVDDRELIEAAINGMLMSLDPHSGYLPPENYAEMQIDTRGEFGGLGIQVTQEDGWVKVIAPMDDTPAYEAGIKAGDFITHVDGEATLGLTLDEAVDKMRGPVGSEITLTIVREGADEPFDVLIVRDTIKLEAVTSRIEDDIIILRISTFSAQTYPGLVESIEEEAEALGGMENVAGFVIDLRSNPGGLLDQAIKVSDAFLEEGEIVSTRGRDPRDSNRHNATPGDLAEGKPIVVLIDGGSASASEIVAGALQDHHRAILVGERTFGKGSVQTIMELQGDGAMRLTTSRYYTPSGRSIQSLGVMPDVVVEQRPREEEDEEEGRSRLTEADLRGSLENEQLSEDEKRELEAQRAAQEDAARRQAEDYQMSYALNMIKGLSVVLEQ